MRKDFEMSADAKLIRSVLQEAMVGDVVTYEMLSQAIGRDVRKFGNGAIRTARKSIEPDGFIFANVRGVGYQRLDDTQVVRSSEKDRRHIQRTAKRTLVRLGTVNYSSLDGEAKREHLVASAQFGAMGMFASKNAAKQIEKKATGNGTIAIGETLKMFTE